MLVSIVLGAVIIGIGLHFRAQVKSAEDTIVGVILLLTALGFTIVELTGHGHHHEDGHHHHAGAHTHEHDHAPPAGRLSGIAAVMVPFGAAASPDLTILPVFLAATAAGTTAAIGTVLVFAGITIATIVTLTLVAFLGGLQIRGEWLERWGNLVTAGVLALIGALVLIGVL